MAHSPRGITAAAQGSDLDETPVPQPAESPKRYSAESHPSGNSEAHAAHLSVAPCTEALLQAVSPAQGDADSWEHPVASERYSSSTRDESEAADAAQASRAAAECEQAASCGHRSAASSPAPPEGEHNCATSMPVSEGEPIEDDDAPSSPEHPKSTNNDEQLPAPTCGLAAPDDSGGTDSRCVLVLSR